MDFSEVNKRKYRRKAMRRRREGIQAALILFVAIALIFTALKVSDTFREHRIDEAIEQAKDSAEETAVSVQASVNLSAPLHSAYYILLRLPQESDGFEGMGSWTDLPSRSGDMQEKPYLHNQILMEKNPAERIYPASMTKILAAITVLENISDPDKTITLVDGDFRYYYADGATIAGYRAGDRVSLTDLLYGLMLPSGSECASALAKETAGDADAFVALMNAKAAEIGMTSSHFTNPVGLHSEENYSTVSDIALLLDYALRNRVFSDIFTSPRHTAAPSAAHPNGLEMKNNIFPEPEAEGEAQTSGAAVGAEADTGAVLGGKTGFVDESGQCLASLLSKGGVRFVLVTAAAMPEDSRRQTLHVDDMRTVLGAIKVEQL
ncbi:MAG: serine hydrolase [Clostridiales Family XIII bacterium]|nr:serine hydrolase [Clostridiales Family XIII bacterium]